MNYVSFAIKNVDIHNYDSISEYLNSLEKSVSTKGGSSSWGWMGIEVSWHYLPLSKGGNMKRGSSYGVIKYRDMYRSVWYNPVYLTRDEAIKEIMKSPELREALVDMTRIELCSFCGCSVVGEEDIKKMGILEIPQSVKHRYEYLGKIYESDDVIRKRFRICAICLGLLRTQYGLKLGD